MQSIIHAAWQRGPICIKLGEFTCMHGKAINIYICYRLHPVIISVLVCLLYELMKLGSQTGQNNLKRNVNQNEKRKNKKLLSQEDD